MAESQARLIAFVERMPRPPLVEQFRSMSWITDRLAGIPQRKTPLWWWFERFAIIALSLHRDFVPSSWGMYYPTWVDVSTYVGTVGLFVTLFLLFIRVFPMIAMSEVKGVLSEADPHYLPEPVKQ